MQLQKLRKIPIIISLVFFLLLFGSSSAQPALLFELAPSLEFAQIVYVSDFDFYQQGATQFLFQLTVQNQNPVTGYLEFQILRNGEILAETQSNTFSLLQNESFTVSNIELNAGYITPIGNEPIRFDKSSTTNPSSDFEDEVLTSGKLPNGTYEFVVRYRFNNNQSETSAPPVAITINNPTFIRPIMPGTNAAGGQYLETVYSQFPTFQFETDLDLNDPRFLSQPPFRVQIFKKLDQHSSIDEVLTTQPHYDERLTNTVFPYPAVAAQPLDEGVYLWQVRMELITSSGMEVIESPVFAFEVQDPSRLGEIDDEGLKADVMRILEDLLGRRGRQIAEQLSDYKLTAIRVNGETIDKKRLYEIIDGYQDSQRIIDDIFLKGTQ
jgi:hypothetical protein